MKKFLSLLLICILLLGSVLPLSAAANEVNVMLDGFILEFDVPGQIVDGRTMVPLRKIFEALGARVNWNGETQTVTAVNDDTTVKLTIGDPNMVVNGEIKVLDVPGLIIDGRTLVPLRAVSNAFGKQVRWDGTTRTAIIGKTLEELVDSMELLTPPNPGTYAMEEDPVYLKNLALLQNTMKDLDPTFKYVEQDIEGENHCCLFVYMTPPEGTGYAIEHETVSFQPLWSEYVDAMTEWSATARNAFVNTGLDVHCSVVLYHDANPEYMVLQTLDDAVIYDSIDAFLPR